MATYTPPPYFPQSSLAPPDKNRYTKFKLVVAAAILLLLLLLGGVGVGIWYLVTYWSNPTHSSRSIPVSVMSPGFGRIGRMPPPRGQLDR